ncbi:tetratricopeptide repeat protein [Qipengyuania sp. MTN3-11]|uniref:tetratricopeptide repeat protein n=1 Tax=Qipengyuania sp. MTN3-11 TaxID=3056557 RepID=UPI0036F29708
MDETKSRGFGGKAGLLALGVAAAVAVTAVGWRSLGGDEADRVAEADPEAPLSIEELQRRAEASPDDPGVWQELAFARFQRNEFAEAAAAYERAVALDPENAVMWSSLGEARVMASERDPMPRAAVEAFEKALALDDTDPRARYFMAVRKDLQGDSPGAIADWLALLEDTPPGAPWEGDLVRTIEQVGKINDIATESRIAAAEEARSKTFAAAAPVSGMAGVPPLSPGVAGGMGGLTAGQAIPGPTAEQMQAASQMSPDQQQEMVRGMVASREAKQRANPRDVDGWVLLMRSYVTLGDGQKAREALAKAKSANPAARERLDAEARLLGVT